MFKESLAAIIERTDGAIGALIMGTDGIAVEKVLGGEGDEGNLDIASAEFTSLIRHAQRTGTDVGLGHLNEIVLSYESASFIMRLFNRDYFVVLALKPECNLGRGRFELRKAELQLAREFAI
jgi:predicted regulator of Ras-like GTPase activity (Roadblock/LC7/MglB family)